MTPSGRPARAPEGDPRWPRQVMATFLVVLACGAGCGLRAQLARSAGSALVADLGDAVRRQSDPQLVRDGLPSFMLILDTLVLSNPDDPAVLRQAVETYVLYAQAFLSEEEERRAVALMERARDMGVLLLCRREFFARALELPIDEFIAALEEFDGDDVPDLRAAVSAWLGWIVAAGGDSMAALAELPRALACVERLLALEDGHGDGRSHLIFAIFFAVQPRGAGQDLERSRELFETAVRLAGPRDLMPSVIYAEHYGKATLDAEFFERTLRSVLEIDPASAPENRLINELAHERARRLLARKDDIF